MRENYTVYIESFKKYEPTALQANVLFNNLSGYSAFINNKANEIFSIATNDTSVNTSQLQKEITDLGIIYVKLFIAIKQGKVNTWLRQKMLWMIFCNAYKVFHLVRKNC